MDFRWILDKLYESGQIAASQNARISTNEKDIAGLKTLYDRVATLEGAQRANDEQERALPQHRQVIIQTIFVVVSIISLVVSAVALFH